MKLFISSLMLMSMAASADCLVELQSPQAYPVESFVERTCRDALRECNLYKRQNSLRSYKCNTIDSNYTGGSTTGGSGHGDLQSILNSMSLIDQAANYLFENMHVMKNVSGWAHQLYINNNFHGNFNTSNRQDIIRLKRKIRNLSQRAHPLKSERKLKIILKRPKLINNLVMYRFDNCNLVPSNPYHQLYINNQFRENYNLNDFAQKARLRSHLANLIVSRTCKKKTQTTLRLMDSPFLIQDMIDLQYSNCRVAPRVSGWAHQLFINGSFRGNYNVSNPREEAKLKSDITKYIESGTCIYDPI